MDGTSTEAKSDRFLRATIRVSGGKNVATGLVIPIKPAKMQPGGPGKSRGHRPAESNIIG